MAAIALRSQIQSGDTKSDADADLKLAQLRDVDAKLLQVRMQGNVAIASFLDGCGKSKKDREALVLEYSHAVRSQPQRMMELGESGEGDRAV